MKNRKTILLINKSGLNTVFKKALQEQGFEVVSFFDEPIPAFKKNIFQKYANIFYRIVLKDKTYLQKQEKEYFEKELVRKSNILINQSKFDYALFFRADLYPEKMISTIRNISEKMISYQYDGMEVCQKILNYTSFFDRIFVFDPVDFYKYQSKNFLPLTNCWFPDENPQSKIEQDFFYVGVGTDDRKLKITRFQEFVKSRNYDLKAILTIPEFRAEEKNEGVEFRHKGLSYQENMELVRSSKAVLDFKLDYHNGLSFRFFEAMNYEKKSIAS